MAAHLSRADGFVAPCNPIRALKPPAGPDWVHEIKHDGYRMIVRREGATVRLFTANLTQAIDNHGVLLIVLPIAGAVP